MAYDEELADRVRDVLASQPDVTERKMFGGLAFLDRGNLCAGILGDEVMVRVGADAYEAALALPHAREMDFTGRPMRGLVMVAAPGVASEQDLERWVARGRSFTGTLPSKG